MRIEEIQKGNECESKRVKRKRTREMLMDDGERSAETFAKWKWYIKAWSALLPLI